MNDEQKKETTEVDVSNTVELTDEELDDISGGLVYHDLGDPKTHRKETFYVLSDSGDIIMRFDNEAKAKHWAGNLRTDQRLISADEFNQLRRGGGL